MSIIESAIANVVIIIIIIMYIINIVPNMAREEGELEFTILACRGSVFTPQACGLQNQSPSTGCYNSV